MKKLLFFYLAIFCTSALAQKLTLHFDYAQFRYDSTSNYLEVYYSFDQSEFVFKEYDGIKKINGQMKIQIQNQLTDELIVNKTWTIEEEIKNINGNNNVVIGAVGFIIKGGSYNFTISVNDLINSSNNKEGKETINITPFSNEHFSLSDIELSTRIINQSANENSIFYKNTLEVYPNPAIVYTNKMPVLFFYCELYGLNSLKNSSDLSLEKKVFSSKNQLVHFDKKNVTNSKESIVEVGLVNLKKFPTDTYTLVLSLSDSTQNKIALSTKKFFFVNPDVKNIEVVSNISTNYLGSEFGVYNEEDCADLFQKSKIIATDKEIEAYENLDSLNQKKKFLFDFWKKRDDIPYTDENEFKNNYLQRVETASIRFKTMSSPGYKTDRGIVYLRYGEPDQIDRYPNELNAKPYEIWNYNQIEGGVYFIFGDITGFNYYELVHSTKRGELQDPNWKRRIYQSNSSIYDD